MPDGGRTDEKPAEDPKYLPDEIAKRIFGEDTFIGKGRRIRVRKHISAQPMSAEKHEMAESLLAKLVARAYAEDHPELFPRRAQKTRAKGEPRQETEDNA